MQPFVQGRQSRRMHGRNQGSKGLANIWLVRRTLAVSRGPCRTDALPGNGIAGTRQWRATLMQRDCVHACFPRDDHLSRQAYTYRGICVSEFEIDVLDKIRHTSSTLRLIGMHNMLDTHSTQVNVHRRVSNRQLSRRRLTNYYPAAGYWKT